MKKLIIIFAIIALGSVAFAETYYMSSMGNGNYMVYGGGSTKARTAGKLALGVAGGYPQAGAVLDYAYENFDLFVEMGVDYKNTNFLGFGGEIYCNYQFTFDKVFQPVLGAGVTFGVSNKTYVAVASMIGFKFIIGNVMPFVKANLGYAFINYNEFYWDAQAGITYRF